MTDELIIGDISGSTKGFAKRSPKQLETLYRVLFRNTTTGRLAKMPGDNAPFTLLSLRDVSLFANPRTYRGNTPLVETISQSTSQFSAVVIATDGMESDNLYVRLEESMTSLTQNGWGIWIILLPMSFDGKYDLEQPLNPDLQLDRMRRCVQQQNSAWTVSVEKSALRTIQFFGERPLLLLVFNKDPSLGRRWVVSVAGELANEIGKPEVVELAPLYVREYTVASIQATSLGAFIPGRPEARDQTIVADPADGGPMKRLMLNLDWKSKESAIIQPFEEQWMLRRDVRTDWADLQIIKSTDLSKSPGALALLVNSEPGWWEWLKQTLLRKPILRDEQMQFTVNSTLQKPVEGWWKTWNSETTWECPQKVFKLADLVDRISQVARKRLMKNPPQETHALKLQIGTS